MFAVARNQLLEENNSMNGIMNFKRAIASIRADPPLRTAKQQHAAHWDPYSFEGGSAAAIAGDDFVVIASDTRMSQFDVNILSRDVEKVFVLNDSVIMATSGFYGDVLQFRRLLEARLHKFRFEHRVDMPVDMCSEMMARNLYYKRFFPYFTGAILAGIDEKGHGAVYNYDCVGCIERRPYDASGNGSAMMMPTFDNQIGFEDLPASIERPPLTQERAISLMKDAFRTAADREISIGDRIQVYVAEAGKPIRQLVVALNED